MKLPSSTTVTHTSQVRLVLSKSRCKHYLQEVQGYLYEVCGSPTLMPKLTCGPIRVPRPSCSQLTTPSTSRSTTTVDPLTVLFAFHVVVAFLWCLRWQQW